ncbi:ABC transporter permease [Roseiarcaceae bacterium H3SJ34-1]|uniref:ABC transporter permease n=1 Tax=Terripilifer ovatus TaxID=3032367 RepID=UPI003AB989F4|nr:ABC transporter permease [Roseiarcaceae bacterium H3SJ34-1]
MARWTASLFRYSPLLILAALWEAVAQLGLVARSALPPLSDVIKAWFALAVTSDFWFNAVDSLYRTFAGLALAVVVGAAIGIAMASSKPVRAVLNPIVEVFYPLPKSALIPVTALWLGFGDMSKILLIFLGCMLPVTLGAYNGARGSEQTLMWSARSLGASRWRMLMDVVFPSAVPEILNGVRTALATSFVLLVSSEMIAARSGLGFMIGFLGDGGNFDAMFAVVFTVAFMGFIADRLYQYAMQRTLQWR